MRMIVFCFIGSMSLLVVQPVSAKDDALRAALSQRYAAIKTAMAARDTRALGALLTPDFRSEELDGKVQGRADLMAELASLPPQATTGESETTLSSVTRHGGTVQLQQRYSHTTHKGQPPHAIELVTVSSDTWTRVQGNWLLSRTRTDSIDYQVDGKAVMHKARDLASPER